LDTPSPKTTAIRAGFCCDKSFDVEAQAASVNSIKETAINLIKRELLDNININ
jgi:hypothetical protein